MALEGELILLCEERAEDLPFLLELRNDLDTQGWSKTLPTDYTASMYMQRFESREFSFDREDARFVIESVADDSLIGTIGYTNLDPRMTTTIGIAISKPFWGTGMANDAQETLLRFLYIELGVRVVRLLTHSGNPRAVKLAEKAGFRISVCQRESIFKNGQLFDNLVMDMLREEYYERHPELVDHLPPVTL